MKSKLPKYVELYSQIRQAILDGEYQPGAYLPTENELMTLYNVSKTTVRHAVRLLREGNLVDVKQGSGTRIIPQEDEKILVDKYNSPSLTTELRVNYVTSGPCALSNTKSVIDLFPANETVSQALSVTPGENVYRMQRMQLVDGLPFSYMVNYMRMDMIPGLQSKGDIMADLYGHLYREYGLTFSDIEETVDVMTAGFMESQFLNVDVGTPLLLLKRKAGGRDRRIIEYCETFARPDIFQMTVYMHATGAKGSEPFWDAV